MDRLTDLTVKTLVLISYLVLSIARELADDDDHRRVKNVFRLFVGKVVGGRGQASCSQSSKHLIYQFSNHMMIISMGLEMSSRRWLVKVHIINSHHLNIYIQDKRMLC